MTSDAPTNVRLWSAAMTPTPLTISKRVTFVSKPRTGYPDLARLEDMNDPIVPRPINPIIGFILWSYRNEFRAHVTTQPGALSDK